MPKSVFLIHPLRNAFVRFSLCNSKTAGDYICSIFLENKLLILFIKFLFFRKRKEQSCSYYGKFCHCFNITPTINITIYLFLSLHCTIIYGETRFRSFSKRRKKLHRVKEKDKKPKRTLLK